MYLNPYYSKEEVAFIVRSCARYIDEDLEEMTRVSHEADKIIENAIFYLMPVLHTHHQVKDLVNIM